MKLSVTGFFLFAFGVSFLYWSEAENFNGALCFWAYMGSFLALIDFFCRTKAWISFSNFFCFLKKSCLIFLFVALVFYCHVDIINTRSLVRAFIYKHCNPSQTQLLIGLGALCIGIVDSFRFHIKSSFCLNNFKKFLKETQYIIGVVVWGFIQIISYYGFRELYFKGAGISQYFFFH